MEPEVSEIDKKYYAIVTKIRENSFFDALTLIEEMLNELEDYYDTLGKRVFCFEHILDTYYYTYFFKDAEKLEYSKYRMSEYYRAYGYINIKLERFDDAIKAYNRALYYNPVDLDSYLQLTELYKKIGSITSVKQINAEAYRFCCSRQSMAHYYRNLGFYYLETKRPDVAKALYVYSNIYYETKQALNEIDFIDAAKESMPDQALVDRITNIKPEVKGLQEILKSENINLGPNPDTIGITYRVGKIEFTNKNYDSAYDCFMLVYDLTLDENVKKILDELKEIKEKPEK